MTQDTTDWGPALSDDDIELLASPEPEVIDPRIGHVWVAVYMTNGCTFPMTMTGQDREELVKWVRSCATLDRTKPIKLYRLEY